MMLSRSKPAISNPSEVIQDDKSIPSVESFISCRDYLGAITMLEFDIASGKDTLENGFQIGYCYFHLGDYKKATEQYKKLLQDPKCDNIAHLYLGCCYFYLGMYKEADEEAQLGPNCKLQNRLLFHLSHKFNDEKRLMGYHRNLQDVVEDQLCLASIHYLRGHYQEAIEIYKRILVDHKEYLAVNVYIAMCYYKLEYYDVSQEILQVYLQQHPDSVTARNLKACNHFKLYNGKLAMQELNSLSDSTSHNLEYATDLLAHNRVVFNSGQGALKVLTGLVGVIPEARLNLTIHCLKNSSTLQAYELIKDLDPVSPSEYILKAIVFAVLGQEQDSKEYLKVAQDLFKILGSSASECDTIPGRQAMASCFVLLGQFEDSLIYFDSIKGYFYNDDTFNYNFGQAKVATGDYVGGEETLLLVQNEQFKREFAYTSHLVRCYIMNNKPELAWNLYESLDPSAESFNLLQIIANDCYRIGNYYHSAKAFDVLERMDPSPEYWEGKRGACLGTFKQFMHDHSMEEEFRDVLEFLLSSSHPQVESIVRVMKTYARENRIAI